MIFHGVRTSFVKNAGLALKSRNSVKKNRRKILKTHFVDKMFVVYEALVELFEKNYFVELQSIKNMKF